jgi:predicted type IV restriction endonuclease
MKDVNESDTVTIIADMLSDVFGYDKYTDITSEYAIRGTYCDLAIKDGDKVKMLIECKAVGVELKDIQNRQAVDYGANEGIEWIVLTNGHIWKVYKISFGKPVSNDLLYELDLTKVDPHNEKDQEHLFVISKEGWSKDAAESYYEQMQALNRHMISAIIQSDDVIAAIKRELKKITPDVNISPEQVSAVVVNEVLKREVVDGEDAVNATKKLVRLQNKHKRARSVQPESAKAAATIQNGQDGDQQRQEMEIEEAQSKKKQEN